MSDPKKSKLSALIPPSILTSTLLWAGLTAAFAANVSAHESAQHTETNRLVSAGAGMTELVLALDAGTELVAVDSTSLVPEEFTTVEKLGYHRMLSAEGILALDPDLVLGTDAMGPETTLEVLRGADVKVVKLTGAETAEQLLNNIDTLGKYSTERLRLNHLNFALLNPLIQLNRKEPI